MQEWRKFSALGVLINVLHFIKTLQQYDKLHEF